MTRWWRDLPIRLKGLVVVAIPLAALLVATFSLYLVRQDLDRQQDTLRRTQEVRAQVQTVLTLLLEAETGVRGFRLSMDPAFLRPYETAFSRLPPALASLEELVGADPEQLSRASRVRFLAGRQLEILAALRERSPGAIDRSDVVLARDNELMNQLRTELDAMREVEDERGERQLAAIATSTGREQALLVGAVVFGLLGGLLAMILFTTGVAHRLQRLEQNARLLAQGDPLPAGPGGHDELGILARQLGAAAELLSDRERRLRTAKDEAEKASWAKSDFLSQTSHELRTPLSSILGFVDLLQRGALDPDTQVEALDRISRTGNYLARLLNDVLDIGLVEAGVLSIAREPVYLTELLADCVELMRAQAEEAEVRIEVDPAGCADVSAAADNDRVRQVLLNLLSNAIKYNRTAGSVRITCAEEPDFVRLDVSDEGSGIAPEQIQKLFMPYERLGAEHTKVKGVGLGLALSKSLVELMGGTLEVRTGSEGSTFSLRLPLWRERADRTPHGREEDAVPR
ncbi:MAG: ATP-binding protein [Actinomycetota bacterium]